MDDSGKPVLKKAIQGCSRLFVLAGAAVFFVGDRFLHEVEHVDFPTSELVGIGGGVLLMMLGAGIGMLGKSPKN